MANSKRSAEKEAFWREVLRQHRQSGLSVRSFCERKGIAEQSFYAWRKKLNRRDAEREAQLHGSGNPQLIPVSVVDLNGPRPSVGNPDNGTLTPCAPLLEVITPHGVTVRLHQYIDPRQFDLLMAVISRIPAGGVPAC